MRKITFTVQLDKNIHKQLTRNATAAGLKKTDYARIVFREEIKTERVLKKIACNR